MIKFFRKIRQNLVMQNKTTKYFKYAIGEIVLVVIGILIALQINIWSQRKSNEVKIISILKEIQNDILIDLEASNMIFDYQIFTDSISKNILNNNYTSEDFKNGKFQRIGFNYRDFRTVSNGFDNLMDNVDNIPEKYAHLLPEIKDLYVKTKITIDVYNDKIRNVVYKNLDEEFNFNWKQDDIIGKENNDKINYYLNDVKYKNLVANYMLYRGNVFQISNQYRVKAIDLYLKINDIINNEDTVPEIVNYKNRSSINYTGTYKLKETVNLDGRWDENLNVVNQNDQLAIIFSKDDFELKLLSYNKDTFFPDEFYGGIITFDRPQKGHLHISRGINSFAIYEKVNQKK